MMKNRMKNTLRNVLIASVAGGILLTACANKEGDTQQPKVDTSRLQPPRNNPQAGGGDFVIQPQSQAPVAADDFAAEASMGYEAAPAAAPAPVAAKKEGRGLFDWMWKSEPQQKVDTSNRRAPALNQSSAMDAGMGGYAADAPVAEVQMADAGLDAPLDFGDQPAYAQQDGIIVADEVIMMDETFTPAYPAQVQAPAQGDYPSLHSVPLRPERVNAIQEKDARMAELQQAHDASMEQSRQLNAQLAADAPGSMLPQQSAPVAMAPAEAPVENDIDAEFAALVAGDSAAPQPFPVAEAEQAPAPVVMASQQPWEAPAEDLNWAPAPLSQPAQQPVAAPVQVAQPAPQPLQPMAQPIVEDEWVSLQQDPAMQMAIPVEQVDVYSAPEVMSASAVPVMPADEGIQLVPPSSFGNNVRTLPESRYAARRQAVYMQRYARMSGAQ